MRRVETNILHALPDLQDAVEVHQDYLTQYFKELNANSKSIDSGETLSKVYLIAAKVLSADSGCNELDREARNMLFRVDRMMYSKNRTVYWSRVFKQQASVANDADCHPLKAVVKFLFQNMWLDN